MVLVLNTVVAEEPLAFSWWKEKRFSSSLSGSSLQVVAGLRCVAAAARSAFTLWQIYGAALTSLSENIQENERRKKGGGGGGGGWEEGLRVRERERGLRGVLTRKIMWPTSLFSHRHGFKTDGTCWWSWASALRMLTGSEPRADIMQSSPAGSRDAEHPQCWGSLWFWFAI